MTFVHYAKRSGIVALVAALITNGSLAAGEAEPADSDGTPAGGEEFSGGETTVFDTTRGAFSLAARNLREVHRPQFFVGNSFFNENWVAGSATIKGRDGLGPLFNARSCSACHFKDGRDRPPENGGRLEKMILRVSLPGRGPHGAPIPDPIYGGQIQTSSVQPAASEFRVRVEYDEIEGAYASGEKFTLRKPRYALEAGSCGSASPGLLRSARIAPTMVGLGLLEAISDETLLALADPDDRNADGISGRVNRVWDVQAGALAIGRFGWKAEQPTVLQQVAGAFNEDMGLTTALFPDGPNATGSQSPQTEPEVKDETLQAVAQYSRLLAPPARRGCSEPEVLHGKALFTELQCAACHVPHLTTGPSAALPELAGQSIQPFTDLLLHDMGHGLSDDRPSFEAEGSEWRTPPLWGIGLVEKVNGHTFFLHDGRARNLAEAILWHGGEAAQSQERFRQLPLSSRAALLAFLQSL